MKERVITGFFGALFLLSVVYIGGYVFTSAVILIAIVAMYETLRMKGLPIVSPMSFIGMFMMMALLLPDNWWESWSWFTSWEWFVIGVFLLFLCTVLTKNFRTYDDAGFVTISAIYIGYGFHHLLVARAVEETGFLLVLLILFLIWSTDTGAYFVGKTWGRRKLWPAISPKKTLEGSIGGIGTALFVGILFYSFFPLFPSFWQLLLFVFVISIFGQVGDLVESALKRHVQVKDSGTILPGHGGILDRFDSLLFVMPILYFFQLLG